jgi:fibronectin-binding autotransporter adhesin
MTSPCLIWPGARQMNLTIHPMKPNSILRHFLALAGSSLMAMSSAHAQTTYTWTQTTAGSHTWGTSGNWSGGNVFVSGSSNELMFFPGVTNDAANNLSASTYTITGVPTTLSMSTLTLNGRGPNSDAGTTFIIGDNTSTWTIGDGTTSTVNLNSTLGGGGANRDLRYTIGANLTLVGDADGITTFTGASTSGYGAVFSGDITGTGKGITKSGTSLLVFSGNNSYTGRTSVTGGVLRLSSANALSGGIGTTGGTSALRINGGVVELGATDFSRGLGSGSSQFEITGGSSGFSAHGGPRVVTVNGDASEELVWGSTHFAPTTLVLNQAYGFNAAVAPYANGTIELTNKIDLNGSTRTVQVGANIALLSNDIRTTSGTAGLTKTGNGTLVLTGNNTYNGSTTLSAGVLSVDAANNLGAGASNLILNAGTLQIRGTTLTSLSGLGRTVTFNNNAKGFDIHNAANTFTVDQAVSGTTFAKSGVGTLVLNQNNAFTGASTVTGGGTLVLDYTTNNGSKLSDTAALTLSGTALVLKGGSHTELVSSTTLGHQTGNSISRDGGTSKISLGALTAPSGNQMYTLAISEANIATTTTNNTNGILALGRVTVGSHFGANDGSGNIVAYSGYTAATTAGGGNSAVVHQLAGGGSMGANLASYSLRIVNDDNSNVLDLNGRNISLTNNGTLLYAGGFDNNYTIEGTAGAVTSASGNQPFVINTYAGTTLTINSRVTANLGNIQKAGLGTLVLGGNSQLGDAFGPTVVQQGILRLAHADALGTTATGTVVQGGAALELSGGLNFAAEPLTINGVGISNGGALRNQSGTNSFAGAITIGASGARINSDASTSLTLTGGIATTLTQDVTFGGAGNTTVSTTAISGSGSVIKDGAGILTLSAANTYTGATTVSAGTLIINGSTASTSLVTVNSGATLGGNGTIAGAVTVNGFLKPGNSTGLLTVGSLDLNASSSTTLEINGTNRGAVTNGYDALGLSTGGSIDFQGSLTLVFGNLAAFANGTDFDLFSFDTTSTGDFASVTSTGFYTGTWGKTGDIWSLDSGGQTLSFSEATGNLTLAAVIPEPSAALLGAIGLIALLRRRR